MRIVVDALAANFGGTAYAGVQIGRALAAHESVERVAVIARPRSIVARGVADEDLIDLVVVQGPRHGELAHRSAWEAVRLPSLTRRYAADGLFVLSGMLPRRPGVPVIGLQANPTVYGATSPGARVRRAAVASTSKWATATYVPSNHVLEIATDIRNASVVPLGVDRSRFAPTADPGSELLCVADFYPHKRHDVLLAAYAALPPNRPSLRLIGNPDVAPEHFAAVVERASTIPGVRVDGRVPFADLVEAYRSARAFLIASEQESFCMPVAEALASGVPVIANALPSLRETAGPGGRFVAGGDVAAWTTAIETLLVDDAGWAAQRNAGLAHAARFSWSAYADRLVEDFTRAVA